MAFYEKVIKVKADVAALLTFLVLCVFVSWDFPTTAEPPWVKLPQILLLLHPQILLGVFSGKSSLMFAGAIVLSDGSIALAATLVLPPALSLLSVRFALRHDENYNAAQWIRYLRLFRVVPLFTVAMWWSLCDTFPQSGLLRVLLRFCPRSVCFLLAPAVSIALARVIGYSKTERFSLDDGRTRTSCV
jgi:hypothetical protein